MRSFPRLLFAVAFCATAAFGSTRVSAQEPVLLSTESDGLLELDGETKLEISGIVGTLSVRLGTAGELRFAARALDSRREERPVALWLEGRTLRFAAADGMEAERLLLDVTVAPELRVAIEAADSIVKASGLPAGLDVRGARTDVDARGISGAVDLELDDGKVRVEGIGDGLTLEGSKLEAQVGAIAGDLSISVKDSDVRLTNISAPATLELENSALHFQTSQGVVRLSAQGGRVHLAELGGPAELRLTEAPLELSGCGGTIDVETDASVQFSEMKNRLVVNSYGGTIRGTGSAGGLELNSSGGSVILSSVAGPLKIEGDDLKVQISEIKDDLTVRTSYSNVSVELAEGNVDIENDYGSVRVVKASQAVRIVNKNGNVHLGELSGIVDLKADSDEVVVGWTTLPADGKTTISNDSGHVWIRIPPGGRAQVAAKSRYGAVESHVEGITVADDGKTATGGPGKAGGPFDPGRSRR